MDPLGKDGRVKERKPAAKRTLNADEGRYFSCETGLTSSFLSLGCLTPLVEPRKRGPLSAPLVCQEYTTIACLGTALDPTLGVEALEAAQFLNKRARYSKWIPYSHGLVAAGPLLV